MVGVDNMLPRAKIDRFYRLNVQKLTLLERSFQIFRAEATMRSQKKQN